MAEPQPPESEGDLTDALLASLEGSGKSKEEFLNLAYPELRRVARRYLSRERAGHTLQPTALVHEAYMRMVDQTRASPRSQSHFVALAAQMMRRILINYALTRRAEKRGGGQTHITLDDELQVAEGDQSVDIIALNDALCELEELDPRQARVVEMKYFGGLSIDEISLALDVSPATVKREWVTAKMWLRRRITSDG